MSGVRLMAAGDGNITILATGARRSIIAGTQDGPAELSGRSGIVVMNHRLFRVGALAVVAVSCLAGAARAFNLTDHAVKAFIRPYALVAAYEAEEFPGVQAAAIIPDKLAANEKSVRLKAGTPALTFKRQLERGTYAVWCIARTDKEPSSYREPMYVELRVKGPAVGPGGVNPSAQWRMRINYMARMHQDVAHLYFDANAAGEYEVSFSLGAESAFDLIVDRLELRDVLSGTWKKGFKESATVYTAPRYAKAAELAGTLWPRAAALARAKGIAGACPPRNTLIAGGGMPTEGYYHEYRLGEEGLAEPNADRWRWKLNDSLTEPWVLVGPTLPETDPLDLGVADKKKGGLEAGIPEPKGTRSGFGVPPKDRPDFNWATEQLGPVGRYTAEDFAQFRKLPGRWPDDGGGFFVPKERAGKTPHNFYNNTLACAFKGRWVTMRERIIKLADHYYETGDPRAAFDGAVMLAHFADAFPSMDYTVQSTMLATWGTYPFNCFAGNHAGEFGKLDYSGWAGPDNLPLVQAYDRLFPFIKDNALLAEAVGQAIPWVRKPADVVELIDVKLVQHFFDVCERGEIRFSSMRCEPVVALVQGDNAAGREMLRRIVHCSDFEFASLMDTLVCMRSRDSTSFIGSMYYAKGPSLGSGAAVAEVTQFAERGKVDVLNLVRHGRTDILHQAAQWLIEPYTAGIHINGVGDVSGPLGYPTMTVGEGERPEAVLFEAWRHYGDARFAWMVENVYGYPDYATREDMEKVRAAAAPIKQDPRQTLPSRALAGFGVGILENHVGEPDFRKRTGVVMRAGYGSGHSHDDSLNLEVFSKGFVALPEFGGRPGYGNPPTGAAQSHCLATIDGRTRTAAMSFIADLPGSSCMEAGFGGGEKEIAARRFVALIDGAGDDAYIVDVLRAWGGRERTYWFHGHQTEAVETPDATDFYVKKGAEKKKAADDIADLLGDEAAKMPRPPFRYSQQAFAQSVLKMDKDTVHGDVYQAVWPMDRVMEERIVGRWRMFPSPRGQKLEAAYDANSPRKFTRLFLAGSEGRKVKTVVAKSEQVEYRIVCAGITEEKAPETVSVFPAVIEPFTGTPFISAVQRLPVKPSERGQPVAMSVSVGKTRQDVIYQSSDETVRGRVEARGGIDATARFAFVSFDESGPRACTLAGGTEAVGKGIGLRVKASQYEAVMAAVDHSKREVKLDRVLPASLLVNAMALMGRGWEAFDIDRAEQRDGATVLHFTKTAETYRAPVFLVRNGREVIGPIEPEHRQVGGWIENERGDKGWTVVGTDVGGVRWLGTGFRGGARMGGPISWEAVPDADGDGKKTLTIKAHGGWKEDMRVEVLTVDPVLRSFSFDPINSPAGYGGTRSYAGGSIVNEKGEFIATAVMPGKMGSFMLAEGANARVEDFTDADGDGQVKFHVYHFGPGAPMRVPTYAALLRESPGRWRLTTNSAVEVTLPATRALRISADGKTWRDLKPALRDGAAVCALEEKDLEGGRVLLATE